MPGSWFGTAHPLEYRWRLSILIVSQPLLAGLSWIVSGREGVWYAPEFSIAAAVAAIVLACIGVLLRIWAASFMTAAVMSSRAPNTDQLVNGGPYSSSRNPLYVGTMLIFAGYGLFFGWPAALAYMLFHWMRYERIIRFEESRLRSRWGAQFEAYCRDVPRWLPRRSGQLSFAGPYFSWDGFWGNSIFVGIAVGYVASLWGGSLSLLIPCELAGSFAAAVYFLNLNGFFTAGRLARPAAADSEPETVAAVPRTFSAADQTVATAGAESSNFPA